MDLRDGGDTTAAVRIRAICERIQKNGPTEEDVADLIAALDQFLAHFEEPSERRESW